MGNKQPCMKIYFTSLVTKVHDFVKIISTNFLLRYVNYNVNKLKSEKYYRFVVNIKLMQDFQNLFYERLDLYTWIQL